jgi:hypothetical protein
MKELMIALIIDALVMVFFWWYSGVVTKKGVKK